jgi:copper(I)-binding protein
MGMGLTGALAEGQTVKGTLEFRNAGTLAVDYSVRSMAGEHRH